jgi:hypothetical protein
MNICRNFNLGLMTKVRACKGVGQEWSLIIKFHAFGFVGECEGMNPDTPKWAPTLEVRVLMDSWIFRGQFERLKLIVLKNILYHWNFFGIYMSEMGLHDPFGYLKHKLWPKAGPGDAPPSSLMDSTTSPKVKITEGKGVVARSLACNTSGVEGCVGTPRWD